MAFGILGCWKEFTIKVSKLECDGNPGRANGSRTAPCLAGPVSAGRQIKIAIAAARRGGRNIWPRAGVNIGGVRGECLLFIVQGDNL
jgi:hypothetical protein